MSSKQTNKSDSGVNPPEYGEGDLRPRGAKSALEITSLFQLARGELARSQAREFSRPIKFLVASQPTRGLDVGSIEYIHQRIIEKRDQGCAVLLVSTELDEVMGLADRIAVMYRGKIIAVLPAQEATKEGVGLLMAGVQPAAA